MTSNRDDTAILLRENAELRLQLKALQAEVDVLRVSPAPGLAALQGHEPNQAELLSRLNAAQQVAQIGSWDWDMRSNEVWWSDETYRLFGVRKGEYVPSFERNAQFIHADDLEAYGSAFRHSLESGCPLELEVRLCTPDGQLKICLARGMVDYDTAGVPLRFVGTLQDITERRTAELERDRLLAAIDQVAEIVCVAAPDGSLRYLNPASAAKVGVSCADAVARKLQLRDVPFLDRESLPSIWNAVASGQRWSGRVTLRGPDAQAYTLDAALSPVYDADGRLTGVVAVGRDITQQVALEQQLVASQKLEAIGRLAGGIAHDFNNLLCVILSCCEFMMEDSRQSDPCWKDLQDVKTAAERATALTGQLLAFSRKQVMQPQVLDLNVVVGELETILRRLIGESIEVNVLRCANRVPVKTDPSQLQQVVMNLVVNARDAMPTGGRLTVETSILELNEGYAAQHVETEAGVYGVLTVSDTGSGFDAETRQHLFEPFYTTKQLGRGTGLGLSTVYGIVKQSGGSILVYSEPALGSTFKVLLPLCASELEARVARPTPERPPPGSETILLVEDDAALRRLTLRMLQKAGYHVLSAVDGIDALEASKGFEGEIHLLLTDVIIPRLSGKKLAESISELRPRVRVLFMSGYTDNAIVHHGVLEPGVFFLNKPFSAMQLTRKVRDVLDSQDLGGPTVLSSHAGP